MSAKSIAIENLVLDTENPRFAGGGNQQDVLQKIVDDQKEKLAALVESIAAEGVNPIERLLVVRDTNSPKRYIALEGNRRLAALKILNNPAVLTGLEMSSALRRRLEAAAHRSGAEVPKRVDCFEVSDRGVGASWIHLRHTGENGGRGVVAWNGIAASRFRGGDPALQALDFVKQHGDLPDETKRAIESGAFPITTLDRLLGTTSVRKRLGLSIKDGKLTAHVSADEAIKPLRKIVLDLAEKRVNVSDLKNKALQDAYIEAFEIRDRANIERTTDAKEVSSFSARDFSTSKSVHKKPRKADPNKRKTAVPAAGRFVVSDGKVARIYRELQILRLDDAPNAIAVLLRVFLELSIDHYMSVNSLSDHHAAAQGGKKRSKTLAEKLREVVEHLVEHRQLNRKDFKGVSRALSDVDSPLSVDLLNAYVHNRFVIPKARDLSDAWDESVQLFRSIWA